MKTVCERGVVTGVLDGTVRVRLLGEAACRKCGLAAMGLCRTGGAGFQVDAACNLPVNVGETVTLLRDHRNNARRGIWFFGFPLAALVFGAILGQLFATSNGLSPDFSSALFGFGMLLLSLVPTLWWHRRQERQGRFLPRVTGTVTQRWH